MEDTNTSLKEEIRNLAKTIKEDKQEAKDKKKKFRLPRRANVGRSKAKKGYVGIAFIKENREVKFMREEIIEGTVMIDGTPYLATTDHVLHHKGKPFMVIFSWSIKPLNPDEHFDETMKSNDSSIGYRYIINRLKSEVISSKKKVGFLIWIIIGVAIIGGIWYLSKSGGLKLF